MADNIEKLQQQLTTDCEVCCSHGMLDKFPNALRVSFLVEHVGIIVCHRGNFTIVAGGDTFKVEHGRTIFLNRGEYFHVVDSSADCLYSLLFYRIDTIRDILGNTVMGMKFWDVINPSSCQIVTNDKTADIGNYISLFASLPDDDNDVFIEKERMLLMLSLTYRLCSVFSKMIGSNNSISERQTDIYIRLIELVGKYYDRHRSVAFYADKLCLSPKYLSSIVKSISGLTVQQHVFKAIVRRSILLMNNTDMSIKQISDSFHFPNPSSFGTFFKKHTGMSPRTFRQLNKKTS
ncbi:MAG: helix-turn-helix domain-containing protein [Prevotellaceae bacterium]|nr:helix-turn-helix domain-containing protein [Prevotellaceae bacterium]